jgi:NTE family protein
VSEGSLFMMYHYITRRDFLRLFGTAITGLSLASCTLSIRTQPDAEENPLAVEEICNKSQDYLIDELGLCLSGGGYRAMLFHVGSLWRLYEAGLLAECTRITSVSGGSITAALLGLVWSNLNVYEPDTTHFVKHVVRPIRKMASKTIDIPAIISGIIFPGNSNSRVENYYQKYLYGDKTFQDLPDLPRFIILASNVQSGALFRFSKPYLADYRVGVMPKPLVSIATAVAASSAFPPFLSPSILKFNAGQIKPCSDSDLNRPPYTTRIELSDGGVYDNLGLEPLKRYTRVFISDAGGKTQPQQNPANDWVGHSYRILNLIDNQVRSLRKRMILGNRQKTVAYWSIRTDLDVFNDTPHRADLSKEFRDKLAMVPTRLKALPDYIQDGLINWGYIACDAILRRHYSEDLPLPESIPYPLSAVPQKQTQLR